MEERQSGRLLFEVTGSTTLVDSDQSRHPGVGFDIISATTRRHPMSRHLGGSDLEPQLRTRANSVPIEATFVCHRFSFGEAGLQHVPVFGTAQRNGTARIRCEKRMGRSITRSRVSTHREHDSCRRGLFLRISGLSSDLRSTEVCGYTTEYRRRCTGPSGGRVRPARHFAERRVNRCGAISLHGRVSYDPAWCCQRA